MKIEHIGMLDMGVDGNDSFYQVTLEEADLGTIEAGGITPLDYVKLEMGNAALRDSRGPGTTFCDQVSVMPFPYNADKFVVVAHIRRD